MSIDVFDTDRFTKAQPFHGKSMPAYFELHYGDIEEDGLWLHAHYRAANDAYCANDGEVPEARREMGWKFQLAGPCEAAGIRSVVMDGTTALMRTGGIQADMPRLDAVSELCIGLSGPVLGRICRVRDYLAKADETLASSDAPIARSRRKSNGSPS